MYTIYMTHPGESLSEIAFNHYGSNDRRIVEELALLNPFLQLQGGTNIFGAYLEPFQAIALPEDLLSTFGTYQMMTDRINVMPRNDRIQLTMIQDEGIDPNLMIAAVAAGYIPSRAKQGRDAFINFSQDFAAALPGASIETYVSKMERFSDSVRKVDEHIETYRTLPKAERKIYFREQFEPVYKAMQNRFIERMTLQKSYLHMPSKHRLSVLIHQKSFTFKDYTNLSQVTRLMSLLRTIGRAIIVVEVIQRADKVEEIYKEHGNWERELAVQVGGLTLDLAIGGLAGFFLTPYGWVFAILGGTAIGTLTSMGGEFAGGMIWDAYSSDEKSKLKPLDCPPGKIPADMGIQTVGEEGAPQMNSFCAAVENK
jgi:hypothetical protein